MEKADWLSITFHWHSTHETFGGCFKNFDTHLLIEGTTAALTNNVKEIWLRHSWGVYT
jgi:hypothetical protein